MNQYKFQSTISNLYTSGQDILLQAPTGAGKTRAALEPGIEGFYNNGNNIYDHPPRMVYAVPMRVLANSFVQKYGEIAKQKRWDHEWRPTIQTGSQPEDTLFEGAVVFATVDQVLASFLNIPYSIPRRLDNINMGAFIGSYLIFDEVHLFPRNEMLLSVLAMLKMLKGISRFILMSATFSATFMHTIGRILDAQVIADDPGTPVSEGRFKDIKLLTSRKRTFYAEDGPLNADAVRQRMHGAQRILCICNTVERAQALYLSLKDDPQFECHLLHSRFLKADRQRKEQFVTEQFERYSGGKPVIVITTQVIEVGVDISSDVLLTECAPAASLIQRAGRCARRENEHGMVRVFQPFNEDGVVSYTPYTEEDNETICVKTWQALTSSDYCGQVITFAEEQRLIEIAHGEADQAFVADLENKIDGRIEEMTACMRTREDGYRGSLIRQQDSVPLYVDANPNSDKTLTERSWQREAFSVSKGQLYRLMNKSLDSTAPFILRPGIESSDSDPELPTARSQIKWDPPLREPSEVYDKKYWRFVAHPQAITYAPDLGLMFESDPDSLVESLGDEIKRDWSPIQYHAERYHEHINGLYFAYTMPIPVDERNYRPLKQEVIYPLKRMCEALDYSLAQAEQLLRLTLALHDIGKLNQPWQRWSIGWQHFRMKQVSVLSYPSLLTEEDAPLAHTDLDKGNKLEKELQELFDRQGKRGNHAVESAQASLNLVAEVCHRDLRWAAVVLTAMMHHHTPNADKSGPFRMSEGGQAAIERSLALCGFEAEANGWAGRIVNKFEHHSDSLTRLLHSISPSRNDWRLYMMYALFVRTLRLADQRSGWYWWKYGDQGKGNQ